LLTDSFFVIYLAAFMTMGLNVWVGWGYYGKNFYAIFIYKSHSLRIKKIKPKFWIWNISCPCRYYGGFFLFCIFLTYCFKYDFFFVNLESSVVVLWNFFCINVKLWSTLQFNSQKFSASKFVRLGRLEFEIFVVSVNLCF